MHQTRNTSEDVEVLRWPGGLKHRDRARTGAQGCARFTATTVIL